MGDRNGGLGEAWLFSAPERMVGDIFPQTSFRDKTLQVGVDIPAASFLPGSTLSAQVSRGSSEIEGQLRALSGTISPLVGGEFTYAAIAEGKESAPGQPTASDLRRIYRMMEAK